MRSAAQLLHRPRQRSAADLVRYLTGVQAQLPAAARLALRARTEGLTAERVDRARLRDRSIVLTWAMRGTLHFVPAEDFDWLVPLLMAPRVSDSHRRIRQEGVRDEHRPKALGLIKRMLEREGPLTRREIAERLRSKGIRSEGQATTHLLYLMSSSGLVCRGPDRGRDQAFVIAADWLSARAGSRPEDALAELATRYLRAHGPSEPTDLAYWAGIRLGDARNGWHAIQHRLVEVETVRGPRWVLKSRAADAEAPRGLVKLLPWFDEYLMGWRNRDLTVPKGRWTTITHGDGGLIYPVVLSDGRVVATWETEQRSKALRVTVRPFSKLAPTVVRGVKSEAKDVADFLALPFDSVTTGSAFVPDRP